MKCNLVYKGMLDPIIISYKLTNYLCVTYLEYNNTLYGFDKLTVAWFHIFLKDRSQKVKIGKCLKITKVKNADDCVTTRAI